MPIALPMMLPTPIAGRDYKLNLPRQWLSWSELSTYLRCPEQYRRIWVGREPRPVSASIYQGSLLGAALEWVGRQKIKGKTPKVEDAIKVHHKYLTKGCPDRHHDRAMQSKDVESWQGSSLGQVRQQNEIFLQLFYNKEMKDFAPVEVEAEFTLELAGVPVHSWIDVVENKFIWDYKTSNSGGWFLNPQKSLQLMLYAVAKQKNRVGYIIFDKKKMDVELKKAPLPLDLESTKAWLEFTVGRVAQAISAGIFPPCNPGENALCSPKWCHAWSTCRGLGESGGTSVEN